MGRDRAWFSFGPWPLPPLCVYSNSSIVGPPRVISPRVASPRVAPPRVAPPRVTGDTDPLPRARPAHRPPQTAAHRVTQGVRAVCRHVIATCHGHAPRSYCRDLISVSSPFHLRFTCSIGHPQDCMQRTIPYWSENIAPNALDTGKSVRPSCCGEPVCCCRRSA